MADESGVRAADARGPACLAQVLTRETSSNDIDVWQSLQLSDIPDERDVAETMRQNTRSALVDLAEQRSMMSGVTQAAFYSADTRKEPRDAQRTTSCWRRLHFVRLPESLRPEKRDVNRFGSQFLLW